MIAKDLIDFDIPFLKKEDKVSKALKLMKEFECSRLPVVVSKGCLLYTSDAADE